MNEWRSIKLSDIVEIGSGKAAKYSKENDFEYDVYGSNGKLGTFSEHNFTDGFLIGRVGAVGTVHQISQSIWASDNTLTIKAKDNTITFKDFLRYMLIYLKLEKYSTKTAQPLLTQNTIKKVKINLPPLSEQQKIAAILSSVDEAIEKTDQIIEQTETVKKGLMQELLTKGIGHTEFKDSLFGSIPEPWMVVKLSDIFIRVRQSNDLLREYPILTIAAKEGLVNQLDRFNRVIAGQSLKKYIKLEKGQFAYNRGNSKTFPYGAIYMQNNYNEALVPFVYYCFDKKDDSKIDKDFYQYFFHSTLLDRQLKRIITSGARQDGLLNISFNDFFNTKVVLPTINEQLRIKEILQSKDEKIQIEKLKLVRLQEIKQGLMQQLLTGKTRVVVDR